MEEDLKNIEAFENVLGEEESSELVPDDVIVRGVICCCQTVSTDISDEICRKTDFVPCTCDGFVECVKDSCTLDGTIIFERYMMVWAMAPMGHAGTGTSMNTYQYVYGLVDGRLMGTNDFSCTPTPANLTANGMPAGGANALANIDVQVKPIQTRFGGGGVLFWRSGSTSYEYGTVQPDYGSYYSAATFSGTAMCCGHEPKKMTGIRCVYRNVESVDAPTLQLYDPLMVWGGSGMLLSTYYIQQARYNFNIVNTGGVNQNAAGYDIEVWDGLQRSGFPRGGYRTGYAGLVQIQTSAVTQHGGAYRAQVLVSAHRRGSRQFDQTLFDKTRIILCSGGTIPLQIMPSPYYGSEVLTGRDVMRLDGAFQLGCMPEDYADELPYNTLAALSTASAQTNFLTSGATLGANQCYTKYNYLANDYVTPTFFHHAVAGYNILSKRAAQVYAGSDWAWIEEADMPSMDGVLRGCVRSDDAQYNQDGVFVDGNDPVAGVQVQVMNDDQGWDWTVTTDADGYYEIPYVDYDADYVYFRYNGVVKDSGYISDIEFTTFISTS